MQLEGFYKAVCVCVCLTRRRLTIETIEATYNSTSTYTYYTPSIIVNIYGSTELQNFMHMHIQPNLWAKQLHKSPPGCKTPSGPESGHRPQKSQNKLQARIRIQASIVSSLRIFSNVQYVMNIFSFVARSMANRLHHEKTVSFEVHPFPIPWTGTSSPCKASGRHRVL